MADISSPYQRKESNNKQAKPIRECMSSPIISQKKIIDHTRLPPSSRNSKLGISETMRAAANSKIESQKYLSLDKAHLNKKSGSISP